MDHLTGTYPTKNTGVAYVYCDYKDTNVQSSFNLFSSLTRQLVEKLSYLPPEVVEFYESHQQNDSPKPTVKGHLKLIVSLSQMFKSTFLLVDALDEFSDPGDFQDWKLLLSEVEGAESSLKLLVTSRPHLDGIKRIFQTSPQVTISANSDDVRIYITSRIEGNNRLAGFIGRYPSLKEEIVRVVNDRVKGM